MKEELFVSGRNIPGIDPSLAIWHWEIPLYLFLGGLAAGILFFAGLFKIMGKEKEMPAAVKWTPIVVPFALVIGLAALFLDLKHQLYFWRLYTTIRIESPMSWGAWTLLFVTPLSIVWVAVYIKDVFPNWRWPLKFIDKLVNALRPNMNYLAWIMMILAVILGTYTGILLSAFNARPLWNTGILGPLFLISGMSTAAASIILFSKKGKERKTFIKINLGLLLAELVTIVHLFMGYQAGSQSKLDAANLFIKGDFTHFWLYDVGFGMLIPALIYMLLLKFEKIPYMIAPILVLIGGLLFRIVMLDAGQISGFVY